MAPGRRPTGIRRTPQPPLHELEDHARVRTLMQNPFPSSQVYFSFIKRLFFYMSINTALLLT